MPFLIPAAAAIGGSLLGSKLSGGGGGIPNAKNVLTQQEQSIQQGRNLATNLTPPANALLSQATSAFSPVAQHYGRLLAGNRDTAMQEFSPEVQRITAGNEATRQSAAQLLPRGGGRSAFFTEQPFEQTRDVTNLLSTGRSTGAEGLLHTGQAMGSQSNALYSTILNALSGANAGTGTLLNYDVADRKLQYEKGKELGNTIFGLLQKYLPMIMNKVGKPSGGGGLLQSIDPSLGGRIED